MPHTLQPSPDILIAGGGIIGLSIALELHHRGARVMVLERDTLLSHASITAAGMLAAHDPHNPPALLPLSELSLSLYPQYIERIESLSGVAVRFQTDITVQRMPFGLTGRLEEQSLDPRELSTALAAAVRATSIDVREHTALKFTEEWPGGMAARTTQGAYISSKLVIITAGAWSASVNMHGRVIPIVPIKGQMLRVRLPPALHGLCEVHRDEHVYVVPRTHGPQAGTALIGATVEHAGFDTMTHGADLAALRARAAMLLPELADEAGAPQVEAWAGLRPATPDGLPLLGGPAFADELLATGHFRNGILLAPATACVLADLAEHKALPLDLAPFSPERFPQPPRKRGLPY